MSSLNICIVSTHYAPETTGNAPYASTLAEGLAATGHHVRVIAAAPHYPFWAVRPANEWSATEISAGGVQVRRFRAYVPAQPNFVNRLAYEVLHGVKFLRATPRDADVILIVSPSLFASVLVRLRFMANRNRPRFVLWMQDLYSAGVTETPTPMSGLLGRAMRWIEGGLARSCDHVVVIHERFRGYVTQELAVPDNATSVIRNWSHVRQSHLPDTTAVRERLGWAAAGKETVVLHAGNMGAKQGLENVVRAAQLAQSRGEAVRFVLLGDGNQKARLAELGHGCSNLQFIDPLPGEGFMEALAAADILLVNERPSHSEAAVPSKLTSYFAAGRPVLAATDPSTVTCEELRVSGAGMSVAPDDPEALLLGVQSLVLDPAAADAYARAGLSYVRSALGTQTAVRAFSNLLGDVSRLQPIPSAVSSVDTARKATS
jgi:glycosyltransferase involved in cell wall biosynthesis